MLKRFGFGCLGEAEEEEIGQARDSTEFTDIGKIAVQTAHPHTPNAKRQTPNGEQRTMNGERRTANDERRTVNSER
jgi:hypothetical protein